MESNQIAPLWKLSWRFFFVLDSCNLTTLLKQIIKGNQQIILTAWKVFKYGVFLVCMFSHSDWILRISPYSFRMRENTDQKKHRIWTHFTQCLAHQAISLSTCNLNSFCLLDCQLFVSSNFGDILSYLCAAISKSHLSSFSFI